MVDHAVQFAVQMSFCTSVMKSRIEHEALDSIDCNQSTAKSGIS